MKKLTGLLAFVASVALIGSAQAVVVTTQFDIPFTANPDSVLKGLTGVAGGSFGVQEGSMIGLTSNTSGVGTSYPIFGLDGGASSTITYDLGEAGAATRQLDTFTIWGTGFDRYSMDWGLFTSTDGINFTYLTSTGISNPMQANDNYNTLTYTFDPGEVVGFRYIQLNNTTLNWTSPRTAQLEATTTAVPEPSTTILAILALSGFVLWKARQFRKA